MLKIAFQETDGAGHIFTRPKHNQEEIHPVKAFLTHIFGVIQFGSLFLCPKALKIKAFGHF